MDISRRGYAQALSRPCADVPNDPVSPDDFERLVKARQEEIDFLFRTYCAAGKCLTVRQEMKPDGRFCHRDIAVKSFVLSKLGETQEHVEVEEVFVPLIRSSQTVHDLWSACLRNPTNSINNMFGDVASHMIDFTNRVLVDLLLAATPSKRVCSYSRDRLSPKAVIGSASEVMEQMGMSPEGECIILIGEGLWEDMPAIGATELVAHTFDDYQLEGMVGTYANATIVRIKEVPNNLLWVLGPNLGTLLTHGVPEAHSFRQARAHGDDMAMVVEWRHGYAIINDYEIYAMVTHK